MPLCGGYTPFPLRMGGGTPRLRRISDSVGQQRGSAYATALNTAVGIENNALARVIDRDGYGCNERLTNQFNPLTTTAATGMLARWERIFGLFPLPTDTEVVRRQRLATQWARIGQLNVHQQIVDTVSALLGPVYVGVTFTTPSNSLAFWPGLNGAQGSVTFQSGPASQFTLDPAFVFSTQGGFYGATLTISNASNAGNNGSFEITGQLSTNVCAFQNVNGVSPDYGVGGSIGNPKCVWTIVNPLLPVQWNSSLCHIDIQVQQPTSYSSAQFYAALGTLFPVLDAVLPAWMTYDWWMPSAQYGGGLMGFYLDDPAGNLDISVFDL